MSNPSYSRVNWKDSPSTDTPINKDNLNKMDKGIADCASSIATKQESTDNNLTTTAKTIRGAINEINNELTDTLSGVFVGTEEKVGKWLGADLYRKCYELADGTYTSDQTLDSNLTTANTKVVSYEGCFKDPSQGILPFLGFANVSGATTIYEARPKLLSNGLVFAIRNQTVNYARVILYYTKTS